MLLCNNYSNKKTEVAPVCFSISILDSPWSNFESPLGTTCWYWVDGGLYKNMPTKYLHILIYIYNIHRPVGIYLSISIYRPDWIYLICIGVCRCQLGISGNRTLRMLIRGDADILTKID